MHILSAASVAFFFEKGLSTPESGIPALAQHVLNNQMHK